MSEFSGKLEVSANINDVHELVRHLNAQVPVPSDVVTRGLESLMAIVAWEQMSGDEIARLLKRLPFTSDEVIEVFVSTHALAERDKASLAEQGRVNGELGKEVRDLRDKLREQKKLAELALRLADTVAALMKMTNER